MGPGSAICSSHAHSCECRMVRLLCKSASPLWIMHRCMVLHRKRFGLWMMEVVQTEGFRDGGYLCMVSVSVVCRFGGGNNQAVSNCSLSFIAVSSGADNWPLGVQ